MSPIYQFSEEMAVEMAAALARAGHRKPAAELWWGICRENPYDRRAREHFGDLFFESQQATHPLGSEARSRFILHAMGLSFPTRKLSDAYFENVHRLLAARTRRTEAGRVVLCAGPGRCGSTSLAGALAPLADVCATHENPPVVFWRPIEEQVRFHVERFRLLSQYFEVVLDASHWWLPAGEPVLAEFPTARMIGLVRDTEACVRSFMSTKGSGPGSLNHWAAPGNGIWSTSPGDPSYPSYAVPSSLLSRPDEAKRALIERYVREYRQELERLAAAHPDRVLLIETETLSSTETSQRLSAFLGVDVPVPSRKFNVGNSADSDTRAMSF